MWLSLRHPRIVLGLVLAFLVVFIWAAPRVFRAVRLQFVAFMIWLGVGERLIHNATLEQIAGLNPEAVGALKVVATHATAILLNAARVQRALHLDAPASGIRAAATDNIRGLGNSIGYLVMGADDLAFVAKRGLRQRVHRIKFADVRQG